MGVRVVPLCVCHSTLSLQELYVKCCPTCAKADVRKPATAGHRPILTKGFGARGQVDLIDMQSNPDHDYKFLLNYQDHGVKLYDCRPLRNKTARAIAAALIDIFTLLGPPAILQCDNGREFSGSASKDTDLTEVEMLDIINEVKQIWPTCLMVNGRPRHSQSQGLRAGMRLSLVCCARAICNLFAGGIERLNQTVEKKLAAWLTENNSTSWATLGWKFVRWQINSCVTKSINMTPYLATFGQV